MSLSWTVTVNNTSRSKLRGSVVINVYYRFFLSPVHSVPCYSTDLFLQWRNFKIRLVLNEFVMDQLYKGWQRKTSLIILPTNSFSSQYPSFVPRPTVIFRKILDRGKVLLSQRLWVLSTRGQDGQFENRSNISIFMKGWVNIIRTRSVHGWSLFLWGQFVSLQSAETLPSSECKNSGGNYR